MTLSSRIMEIYMYTVVLLCLAQVRTVATGTMRAVFAYSADLRGVDAARAWCADQGMAVPAPASTEQQEDMANYIYAHNIGSAWLDGVQDLYPWQWTANGVALLDQGCYRLEESGELTAPAFTMTSYMDFGRCFLTCAESSFTKAGISVLYTDVSKYACSCGNNFDTFKLTKASNCPEISNCSQGVSGYCGGQTYNIRIFHIGGNVSLPWAEEAAASQLCGCLVKDTECRIRASKCRDRRKFICSLPRAGAFSQCSSLSGGTCLVTQLTEKTWAEARYDCVRQGGDLAYLTRDMNLTNLGLWDEGAGDPANYWVGLTASHWKWKTAWKDMTYTKWGTEEPIDPFEQSCVAVSNNGKWKTTRCEAKYPALCVKYEPVLVTRKVDDDVDGDPGKDDNTIVGSGAVTAASGGSQPKKSKARTIGLIIGIVLAVVALIGVLVLLVLVRRNQKKGHHGGKQRNMENPKLGSQELRGIDGPCGPEDEDDIDQNCVNQSSVSARTSSTEVKRALSASSGQLETAAPGTPGDPPALGPNHGAGMVVNPLFDEVLDLENDTPSESTDPGRPPTL